MGKSYFLDTDVWTETMFHDMLDDEFRVYLFLRHSPDCSLTGLDELSVFSIARYTCKQPERVTDIIRVLASKFDSAGNPLVIPDNGLYFCAAAAREKIKSAPKFISRLISVRKRHRSHKSEYAESGINKAYAAFLETWEQELYEYDSIAPAPATTGYQSIPAHNGYHPPDHSSVMTNPLE
ncbi:MAG: hypothetical protein JNL32_01190 [Candidatus Kapabacteria bacterium]|nr:hypothetical protein [Candidatus Kapabacteria bacterium]